MGAARAPIALLSLAARRCFRLCSRAKTLATPGPTRGAAVDVLLSKPMVRQLTELADMFGHYFGRGFTDIRLPELRRALSALGRLQELSQRSGALGASRVDQFKNGANRWNAGRCFPKSGQSRLDSPKIYPKLGRTWAMGLALVEFGRIRPKAFQFGTTSTRVG